jgi:hypothetical protein
VVDDDATHEVVIVLSDEFAPMLGEFGAKGPIWALRTGELEHTGEAEQEAHPERDGTSRGVTLFSGPADPVAALLGVIDVVDEHHRTVGQAPAASRLRVLGVRPTTDVRARLDALGYHLVEPSAGGFIARRTRG